jgi:threonine synthase
MITLATAHAAKFPEAVEAAPGVEPALPERLADITRRQERFETMGNDGVAVAEYIAARTRAAVERA